MSRQRPLASMCGVSLCPLVCIAVLWLLRLCGSALPGAQAHRESGIRENYGQEAPLLARQRRKNLPPGSVPSRTLRDALGTMELTLPEPACESGTQDVAAEVASQGAWETLRHHTVSSLDTRHGITVDVVQHEHVTMHFHNLPSHHETLTLKLLTKGQNTLLLGSAPQLQYRVSSLPIGHRLTVEVGTASDTDLPIAQWMWVFLFLLLSLMMMVTIWRLGIHRNDLKHQQNDPLSTNGACCDDCVNAGGVRRETHGHVKVCCHSRDLSSLSSGGHHQVACCCETIRTPLTRDRHQLKDVHRVTTEMFNVSAAMTEDNVCATRVTSECTCRRCPQLPSVIFAPSTTWSLSLSPSSKPTASSSSRGSSLSSSRTSHGCLALGRLGRLLMLSLAMAALTAVAVGVTSLKSEYSLHVGVPQSTVVRKVRAFSKHPELAKLAATHASFALVSKLQLMELTSDCHGNVSECEVVAMCDVTDVDVLCRCRRGYYFSQRQCKECSNSCPEGRYMVNPCTSHADAICTPCTSCNATQYEAAVCTTTRDTICVDVTFPVGILPMNSSGASDDGTPISVSRSSNVFMERLVNMKELETPMYVTNNQQTQDFVWHRESGIDIVVGISGVYLIPEYRELKVDDDSQFYVGTNIADQQTLEWFAKTRHSYCKHPVPDYYHLHLEVIKNRTAAARVLRCDTPDKTVPRCPPGYKDGDRYLKWDINTPCDKYTAGGPAPGPSPALNDGFNSIVCPEDSPMDTAIFQQQRPATLEMMFPSKECSVNSQKCDACLASNACPKEGADQSCCGLSCYTQGPCHQYFSPTCPTAQVECASGEIHRFTLMPSFASMPYEFWCHLHYQRPKYLYNITYTLSIPALKFQVPVQSYTARVNNLQEHRRHADVFQFMHVWHDTRMPFEEQLLMRGNHRELEMSADDHSQLFTVHSLKENREFVGRRGDFRPQSSGDSFSTAVQFERPFRYSSTSWYKDGCKKNVSQIFPNQTLFRNDAMRVSAKRVGKEGDHSFQISHNEHSPYIKLSVRDGESVLKWFQGKAAHGNLVGDEISASLTWDAEFRHWSIKVKGVVNVCPVILTLLVFNKIMSSCAGIFDVLVVCPKTFTFTLNLSRSDADLPDIFVLVLNDSVSSHRLVLSSVVSPVTVTASQWSAQGSDSIPYATDLSQWAGIFAVLVLSGSGLATVFIMYLCVKLKARKTVSSDPKVTNANHGETAVLNNQPHNKITSKPAQSERHESSKSRRYLCLFVVLYVVYSLVFTFSFTLLTLYFMQRGMLEPVVGVANLSRDLQRELNVSLAKVRAHEQEEERRLLTGVEQRLASCARHLQAQNRHFLQDYHRSVSQLLAYIFQQDGAITKLSSHSVLHNTSVYTEEIAQFVLDCNNTVTSLLQRFDAHFTSHTKDLSRNSWLDFPREMFLAQEGDPPDKMYMPSNQVQKFLHWLQVDKVDELLGASANIAGRLSEMKLPSPTEQLQGAFATSLDFAAFLPPEPAVASHAFLVLDRPESQDSNPFFPPSTNTVTSTTTTGPGPQKAFLYSERGSEQMAFLTAGDKMEGGHHGPGGGSQYDHLEAQSDIPPPEREKEEEQAVLLYVTLGLFLLLDVLLFIVRMSWMATQLTAARQGYEDRIPTDPVCQKMLAIQSGYHVGAVQELYQSHSYSLENKENAVMEERTGSESEYNVYFCQSYPKSKDDILREIMAHKINNTEQSLGPEPLTSHALLASSTRWRLKDVQALRKAKACCLWLQRIFVAHLVWRFAVTAVIIVFICVLVHATDFWLTPANIRLLVGGQSALRDLRLQVHLSNSHLAGMTAHLTQVLEEHAAAVQQEVSASSHLLATTIHTQKELLSSLLKRLCAGSGTPVCNVTSYSSLPLPALPTWLACNFLPPQPQLYEDSNTENLAGMVLAQLSPLLVAVKGSVFSAAAILITALCAMFLCHAAASVARCHMIISGHLPRVTIFQISEQTSMMYDTDPHRPMQRSASWLESCESGVYVGESELDANKDV